MGDQTSLSRWLRAEMPRRGYPLKGPRAGGMTRLAADAGISQATMSRLLSGRGEPSYDSLRKIGDLWGYSLQQMIEFAGLAEPEEKANAPASSQTALEAVPPSPGVLIAQVDESHLQVGLTIETSVTMEEVDERLKPYSPNEKAMIANMEALQLPPAEIGGTIIMIRRLSERRIGQQDSRSRRRA